MGIIKECGGKMWMMEREFTSSLVSDGRIMGQSFDGPIRVF
jgi:hypothetical protein